MVTLIDTINLSHGVAWCGFGGHHVHVHMLETQLKCCIIVLTKSHTRLITLAGLISSLGHFPVRILLGLGQSYDQVFCINICLTCIYCILKKLVAMSQDLAIGSKRTPLSY